MANAIGTRQWKLDTASPTVIWPSNVFVENIEFDGYIADTDTATITDQHGNAVALLNGAADLSTVRSGKVGWVNGLILSQLSVGGGYVMVYVG